MLCCDCAPIESSGQNGRQSQRAWGSGTAFVAACQLALHVVRATNPLTHHSFKTCQKNGGLWAINLINNCFIDRLSVEVNRAWYHLEHLGSVRAALKTCLRVITRYNSWNNCAYELPQLARGTNFNPWLFLNLRM